MIESASSAEFADYYDDYSVKLPSKADDGMALIPRACQEPEFKFLYKPTCNDFHEHDWSRAYDDPGTVSNPCSENEVNVRIWAQDFIETHGSLKIVLGYGRLDIKPRNLLRRNYYNKQQTLTF